MCKTAPIGYKLGLPPAPPIGYCDGHRPRGAPPSVTLMSTLALAPQKHGFHLIVTPNPSRPASSLPTDTIVLPLSHINDCLTFARTPDGKPDRTAAMAAIQFTLAHELAHLYLRHGVSFVSLDEVLSRWSCTRPAGRFGDRRSSWYRFPCLKH